MSDYLTRLIERSLGRVPQIEPLIAPLHASAGELPAGELVAGSKAIAETTVQPETAERAHETGSATKLEPAEKQLPPVFREGAGPIPSARTETPRKPTTLAALVEQVNIERRVSLDTATSREGAISRSDQPKRAHGPENPAPVPERSKPIVLTPPAERITAVPPVGPINVSPVEAENGGRVPAKSSSIPVERNRVVTKSPPTRAPLAPASRELSLQPLPRSDPPAIHVTIGRVEVRAVLPTVPPARPPVPPAPAPKLSLEEYLKRRNGARR